MYLYFPAMYAFPLTVGIVVSLATKVAANCCVPSQFQASIDTLESLSSVRDKRFIRLTVSYDAKFKKTAVHAIAETEEDQYDQINDFEAQKTYSWSRGICHVQPLGPFTPACIPADAKLVRKSFLGVSPNTWNLKTYLLQSSSDLQYFGTIGDNCIPVELLKTSTKIPQPDGQYMWMFYNVTMGIKDRSVFTPPKFCSQKGNVKRNAGSRSLFQQPFHIFGQ